MAALVSSRTTRRRLPPVSVGIDQVAHRGIRDRLPDTWDEQEAAILAEIPPDNRLDPDASSIELDLHLAPIDEADAIAEGAGNDEPPCLIHGRSHGSDRTTRLADASTRQRGPRRKSPCANVRRCSSTATLAHLTTWARAG